MAQIQSEHRICKLDAGAQAFIRNLISGKDTHRIGIGSYWKQATKCQIKRFRRSCPVSGPLELLRAIDTGGHGLSASLKRLTSMPEPEYPLQSHVHVVTPVLEQNAFAFSLHFPVPSINSASESAFHKSFRKEFQAIKMGMRSRRIEK